MRQTRLRSLNFGPSRGLSDQARRSPGKRKEEDRQRRRRQVHCPWQPALPQGHVRGTPGRRRRRFHEDGVGTLIFTYKGYTDFAQGSGSLIFPKIFRKLSLNLFFISWTKIVIHSFFFIIRFYFGLRLNLLK